MTPRSEWQTPEWVLWEVVSHGGGWVDYEDVEGEVESGGVGVVDVQVNQNLPRTWLRHIQFLDFGRDGAWLVIHGCLVLPGDLDVCHVVFFSLLFSSLPLSLVVFPFVLLRLVPVDSSTLLIACQALSLFLFSFSYSYIFTFQLFI